MTRRRFVGTIAAMVVAPAAAVTASRPSPVRSRFDPLSDLSLLVRWDGDDLYYRDADHPVFPGLPIAYLGPEPRP